MKSNLGLPKRLVDWDFGQDWSAIVAVFAFYSVPEANTRPKSVWFVVYSSLEIIYICRQGASSKRWGEMFGKQTGK